MKNNLFKRCVTVLQALTREHKENFLVSSLIECLQEVFFKSPGFVIFGGKDGLRRIKS